MDLRPARAGHPAILFEDRNPSGSNHGSCSRSAKVARSQWPCSGWDAKARLLARAMPPRRRPGRNGRVLRARAPSALGQGERAAHLDEVALRPGTRGPPPAHRRPPRPWPSTAGGFRPRFGPRLRRRRAHQRVGRRPDHRRRDRRPPRRRTGGVRARRPPGRSRRPRARRPHRATIPATRRGDGAAGCASRRRRVPSPFACAHSLRHGRSTVATRSSSAVISLTSSGSGTDTTDSSGPSMPMTLPLVSGRWPDRARRQAGPGSPTNDCRVLYPGSAADPVRARPPGAFQLLVATILSAQCTDVRVNLTTPALFARYPDPRSMAVGRPGRCRGADPVDRLLPGQGPQPVGMAEARRRTLRRAGPVGHGRSGHPARCRAEDGQCGAERGVRPARAARRHPCPAAVPAGWGSPRRPTR